MPFPPDPEELLERLIGRRDALLAQRDAALRAGVRGLRLDAIDLETHEIEEAIRLHCLTSSAVLPGGVHAFTRARRTFVEIATRILNTDLRLLALRREQLALARRFGDARRAIDHEHAIRAECSAIRKHCERAGLRVPEKLLDGE